MSSHPKSKKLFFFHTREKERDPKKFFASFSSPSKSVSACPSKEGAGFDEYTCHFSLEFMVDVY